MQLLQQLKSNLFEEKGIKVYVLRIDLIHPKMDGNKYFKLKYNIEEAVRQNKNRIISFGGAYSNHIAALAAAGKESKLNTVGIIRGNELNPDSNSTLKRAKENGMDFLFVDRDTYRKRNESQYINYLHSLYPDSFIIPEGGSNSLAVKGCKEIISYINIPFHYILSPCGTGGTIAGISLSLNPDQTAIGIPVLKGADFLERDIELLQSAYFSESGTHPLVRRPKLNFDYHFGGYAQSTVQLENFKKSFEEEFQIPLDLIYTSKMFFGFMDLVGKDYFKAEKTIVLIHTGGLQGNQKK